MLRGGAQQLERTFRTNIFAMFYLAKAALPHMKQGSTIINTASVAAYKGSPQLLHYSASKRAIVAFTRSLAQSPSASPSTGSGTAGISFLRS